jgi:hypothetical protein
MIAEEQLILCSRVIWRPARCLSASGTGRPWHPSDSRGLSAFGCQRKRKPRRSEAFLTGIANTGSNPCPAKFPTRLSKLGRLRRAQAHRNLPLPIYLSIFLAIQGASISRTLASSLRRSRELGRRRMVGTARAADLPVKALPPLPVFNWTGCYVGGFVGGARSAERAAPRLIAAALP